MIDLEQHRDELQQLANDMAAPLYRMLEGETAIPQGNDRIFGALNAIAACAGMVLAGTGADTHAIDFFTAACAKAIRAQVEFTALGGTRTH